ncbi:PREDICTED: histidine-rich glycoprotein-like [Lupinus angustifolius]|uniref:histidine-rich glycoprotein-like n=1 Tax=Lupinus angustifolius TaxID=3871 RepID=UPI00092F2192|nr:PREDICTED: histidine-rich glycoprotein-like [Lupinus angustifolius]
MASQQCPLHHHINTLHCPLHPHRHHHHQHHRHCPHCPLHHRHHSHGNFQSHLLHNPLPLPTNPISGVVHHHHHHQPNTQISEELEHIELDDEELDDEPVFVLTDEWREFFAKSEAKRKLEKKQNKKGKK